MPHLHSPLARLRRHERAVARGYISSAAPVPTADLDISQRLATVGASMAIHKQHCGALKQDIHTAAIAAARAKAAGLIDDKLYNQARAANRAKHSGLCPVALCGGSTDPLFLADP
mmetsp:Transcript_1884/g.5639  ORF Transcript_1884/g.5639 Transcript_1884/m.5639 type:complete len:115 (+) Transcript_1884:54-398(+)